MYKKLKLMLISTIVVLLLGAVSQASQAYDGYYMLEPNATALGGGRRYIGKFVADDEYRVQTNLWNPAVEGDYLMLGNNLYPSFAVKDYSASSYFAGDNEPGCPAGSPDDCHWAGWGGFYENPLPYPNPYSATNDPEDFVDREIHAPASYPSIYQGCHWGTCTKDDGAPFPIRAGDITELRSTWEFAIGNSGAWNASYDIWLDKGTRIIPAGNPNAGDPYLPDHLDQMDFNGSEPWASAGQNDGTEIMIWFNNSGYARDGSGIITPAGQYDSEVTIDGEVYDVWLARVHSFDNNISWNVVSYVRQNKESSLDFDADEFIEDSMNYHCAPGADDLRFPPSERGVGVPCADPTWWLTSVQAGFEIWSYGSNYEIQVYDFSIEPSTATSCEIEYKIRDDSGSSFTVDLGITNNTATTIDNWQLTWTFPGDQYFTYIWNAPGAMSGQNAMFWSGADWTRLEPGVKMTAVGFNGAYSGVNDVPNNFKLNGMACSVVVP